MKNRLIDIVGNLVFYFLLSVILITAAGFALNPSGDKTILGYRAYEVLSGSMSPAINKGDLVLVKKEEAGSLKEGDIVTYFADDGNTTVTHRIIDMVLEGDRIIITTQGDNVDNPDVPIDGKRILGKVTASIPKLGGVLGEIRNNPKRAVMAVMTAAVVIWLFRFAVKNLLSKEEKKEE